MKPYQGFSGWRWYSKSDFFYLALGTEINWFHIQVGPVHVRIARRHKTGGDQ